MAEDLDAVFRAISDPTRRTIIDEMRERDGQTLFEICVRLIERHGLAFSRQAISKHLAILESAGIVWTAWRGRTKLHHLNRAPLGQAYRRWLSRYMQE